MSERAPHVVIVGAGLAGGACAQALRGGGFTGAITLVGREVHAPYDRPCLSKELLAAAIERPPALLPPDFLSQSGVRLRTGDAAVAIDAPTLRVRLASGISLDASHIVLATGAGVRELPVPGTGLQGVHRLRDWEDALALRASLQPGCRLVIVGGGLIGCEVASTVSAMGAHVTLLEGAGELLTRTIGAELGRLCRERLGALGVDVRLAAQVEAIAGLDRVQAVRCADGSTVAADAVLLSIGAEPMLQLAAQAGLACDRGVLVDACGRTSAPGIYAAGDVARWPLASGGSRCLETYINSQQQAAAVAKAILGVEAPTCQVLKGWTRIAGLHLQIAGDPGAEGRLVLRGRPEAGGGILFRVGEDRVLGLVAVDAAREFGLAARLLDQASLPPQVMAALGDESVAIKTLLARPVPA